MATPSLTKAASLGGTSGSWLGLSGACRCSGHSRCSGPHPVCPPGHPGCRGHGVRLGCRGSFRGRCLELKGRYSQELLPACAPHAPQIPGVSGLSSPLSPLSLLLLQSVFNSSVKWSRGAGAPCPEHEVSSPAVGGRTSHWKQSQRSRWDGDPGVAERTVLLGRHFSSPTVPPRSDSREVGDAVSPGAVMEAEQRA